MNSWLNREWTKGIRGSGSITDLKLTAVYALPEHLLIRSNCVGKLNVLVSRNGNEFLVKAISYLLSAILKLKFSLKLQKS